MQAKLHEVELGRLRRRAGEIEATLTDLDAAMASPLVSMLPVHATAARKYVAWQRELADADGAASMLLNSIIGAKTRERLSGSLSDALVSAHLRAQVEADMLEIVSLRVPASLPQGGTD